MKASMCYAVTKTNKYEIWKSKFTLYEPLELVSLLITTWIILIDYNCLQNLICYL